MFTKRKTFLAASLVGLAAAGGTPLFAQGPGYYSAPAAYGAASPYSYGVAPAYSGQPRMMAAVPGYAPASYSPGGFVPASYASPGAATSCAAGCEPANATGACVTAGNTGCDAACSTGDCEPKCDTGCKTECGPNCGGCVLCDPCHEPIWTAGAGVIFLQRDRPTSVLVATDAGNAGNVMTTNAINFNFAPGLDLNLARNFGRNFAVESRYFGLNHWGESAQFTADAAGDAVSPFLAGPAGDSIMLTEKTELHSFELNFRTKFVSDTPWRASVLTGFRYFYIDDEVELTGIDAGVAGDTTKTTAWSNLFGAQIGGDVSRRIGEAGQFSAFAKGGMFLSGLGQHTTQVTGGVLGTDLSATNDAPSTMFEAGITGSIQPTRWLNVRAGYQVLALGGVALAAEQLPFIDGTTPADGIDDNGNMFLHGPTAGFDITW